MAKSKLRKVESSNGTQKFRVPGAEGQNQTYDPALVSLFAQSVSEVQMQITYC